MRVIVENLDGYTCTIEIELTDTGDAVAAKIRAKTGADPVGLRLIFRDRRLGGRLSCNSSRFPYSGR